MMHRPLLNADIIFVICKLLDKNSLSVLARTARFLQDPALRELWRDVEKFPHLFSPLEPSVKGLRPVERKIYFSNAPTSKQWERFRFYAQFVRDLSISDDDIELSSLLMLRHHRPLLPRLKSLWVWSWPAQQYSSLSIFFTPSIQEFTIYSHQKLLAWEGLFAALGTAVPALRDLTLYESVMPPRYSLGPPDFGVSIPHFHNLHAINIPLTGARVHSVLSHLSTLPSLSKIRFHITDLDKPSGNGSKYAFPAAMELSIWSKFDYELMYFMALTSFNNLTDFGINCGNYQRYSSSIFKIISVSCGRCQFLNQIRVNGKIEAPRLMNFSTLYPLFIFTNIRSISVNTEHNLWPTDKDIQNMAESWPHLEEFLVHPQLSDASTRHSPLTLTGLLFLIDKCINLTKITICVDASAKHIPKDTSSIFRPFMIYIEPYYSPIDRSDLLADFLSLKFPDANITAFGDCQRSRLWEEALKLRQYFIKGWQEREKQAIAQIRNALG